MTKSELDTWTFEEAQAYYEHDYPYVLPENEVIDVINDAMTVSLSKMEIAYVRWMLETCNRDLAIEKFIHPAYYYDKERFGAKYFKDKSHLTELLREVRRNCPYLKLYTADYITGLLHDEIQYLRTNSRKERFYGPTADTTLSLGKKTRHDHEMEEIDRLLACLKQIHELKLAAGGFNGGSPNPQQGNVDNSLDRVIARTKELINSRENGEDRRTQ